MDALLAEPAGLTSAEAAARLAASHVTASRDAARKGMQARLIQVQPAYPWTTPDDMAVAATVPKTSRSLRACTRALSAGL